tara:strand:+ start:514 stop:1041 length:528 start_codon:yes stop_codon:yes gene_type:complete
MDINELKIGIIDGMAKIVFDDISNSEHKGTPDERFVVVKSLDYSSKWYTNWLLENKNDFKIPKEEIDDIIKECYTKAHDKITYMARKEEIIQFLQNKIEAIFENGIKTALQNLETDDEVVQGALVHSILAKCYDVCKKMVTDAQKKLSTDIPLEQLTAIVENTYDEKRAKYLGII